MFSSQNKNSDLIFTLYSDERTVFRLKDVAMLAGETNADSLSWKLNYYVRSGRLENPRKGLYCKPNYNREELAVRIFAPAYVSLEYVLRKEGIVFQYDSRITVISYLNRTVEIDGQVYAFRKVKNEVLSAQQGITQQGNTLTFATPERAFLDMVYLNGEMYFDYLRPLDREKIEQILPIYKSKVLEKRAIKLLENDRFR
ncbi:hypothetical protein FACS1894162_1150 [Bacteroidia bacterium]|nr:hypothetical protein FACS1894162_1150 [Bacteroidia bacterium]